MYISEIALVKEEYSHAIKHGIFSEQTFLIFQKEKFGEGVR